MSDMMQGAMQWLSSQRDEHLSGNVIYQGLDRTVEIPATVGRTIFRTYSNNGAAIRTVSRDFLISAEALGFDGENNEPEHGDVIIYDGYRHELSAPANEPVWKWTDGYHRTLRIHTTQLGKVQDVIG